MCYQNGKVINLVVSIIEGEYFGNDQIIHDILRVSSSVSRSADRAKLMIMYNIMLCLDEINKKFDNQVVDANFKSKTDKAKMIRRS